MTYHLSKVMFECLNNNLLLQATYYESELNNIFFKTTLFTHSNQNIQLIQLVQWFGLGSQLNMCQKFKIYNKIINLKTL